MSTVLVPPYTVSVVSCIIATKLVADLHVLDTIKKKCKKCVSMCYAILQPKVFYDVLGSEYIGEVFSYIKLYFSTVIVSKLATQKYKLSQYLGKQKSFIPSNN